MTPIEVVVAALEKAGTAHVSDVLVPEQCARVFMGDGKCYHITIEEVKG